MDKRIPKLPAPEVIDRLVCKLLHLSSGSTALSGAYLGEDVCLEVPRMSPLTLADLVRVSDHLNELCTGYHCQMVSLEVLDDVSVVWELRRGFIPDVDDPF